MGSKDLLLAIDQGTTATKALLLDSNLKILASSSAAFEQHFPEPGQVEHELDAIWHSVVTAVSRVCEAFDTSRIQAIGITNQRETVGFWSRKSQEALSRAIVWQDRRSAPFCERLKAEGLEPWFQEETGLLLDPYFSATKLHWALSNLDAVRSAARRGDLCFGTIDTYLLFRLSSGLAYATEPSNASRTLCFSLKTLAFEEKLCQALGISGLQWPEVKPSVGIFGTTKDLSFLPDGIPITGILGDQQSALLGQGCTEAGSAKCTYGTGSFLLVNSGTKQVASQNRLLSTIAWALPGHSVEGSSSEWQVTYALEGSAFVAGSAVQWFRDQLGLIERSADIEALAGAVDSSEGVVFVPALTGLGAPYWRPEVSGQLTGLTRGTNKSHLARAILEGIAFQNRDLVQTMERDLGHKLVSLRVDGGASLNNLLMQMQADILGIPLSRPNLVETTSLGIAVAAGLGCELWSDWSEAFKRRPVDRTFEPEWSQERRRKAHAEWSRAISKILS